MRWGRGGGCVCGQQSVYGAEVAGTGAATRGGGQFGRQREPLRKAECWRRSRDAPVHDFLDSLRGKWGYEICGVLYGEEQRRVERCISKI